MCYDLLRFLEFYLFKEGENICALLFEYQSVFEKSFKLFFV